MNRLTHAILAAALTLTAFSAVAQPHLVPLSFASDFQTVPVMGNTPGANNSRFQTYVSILNPTSSAFVVDVVFYEASGVAHNATISLNPGQLKTYANFLEEVFAFTGGGGATFRASDSAGGQRNNRFILDVEVYTTGTRYSTSVPTVEFPGTNSPAYSAGITVDSTARTNIGCFNRSGVANAIKATVYNQSGTTAVGTFTLNLAANGWGQTPITSAVTEGYVKFEPAEAAACYAVVVNNVTNDGKFVSAADYSP